MNKLYVQGIPRDSQEEKIIKTIKEVFLNASDNLSWLKPGDLVLLKPALNSPDPYPATTDPLALKAVSELLIENGAKVIAGDQSGVKHVMHNKNGVVYGSSKKCFEKSGMNKSKVDFVAFEDKGWDGFYNFDSDRVKSWKNGFNVTNLVKEADHIISLPRVSTHIMTGVTLGFKNMVGILREDSRIEFHNEGPFAFGMKMLAKVNKIDTNFKNDNKFFEKIVEISLSIQDKLRLTLFSATDVQATFGPDSNKGKLSESYVIKPETGLIFASQNQVAVEAFAIAFLVLLQENVPNRKQIVSRMMLGTNKFIREIGHNSVWENPFVVHGIEAGLGNKNLETDYKDVPNEIIINLNQILA